MGLWLIRKTCWSVHLTVMGIEFIAPKEGIPAVSELIKSIDSSMHVPCV